MTRSRIWDSNGKSPRVPQMWPPASIPWAIMKSHPARSAVTASSMEPTCHLAGAPSCAAFATRSESGTNFLDRPLCQRADVVEPLLQHIDRGSRHRDLAQAIGL